MRRNRCADHSAPPTSVTTPYILKKGVVRRIVAPSTADYVLIRTGRVPQAQSWADIFNFTNANATYRDQTFVHIKNAVQDNLDKYAEKLKQFGV